jgi:hypothetical protein
MSTDKDGTQAEEWRFEANSFAPGWGLLYFGDEANSYAVEIMEVQALAILADRRKASRFDKALRSAREDLVESQRLADEDYDEWSSQTQDIFNHAVNAIQRIDRALANEDV